MTPAHAALPQHGVTVGIEGFPHEIHAVRWAADEASSRGCGLTLVHVIPRLVVRRPGGSEPVWPEMDDWVRVVELHEPQLDVTTLTIEGRPSDHLIRLSSVSQLLVLGVDRTHPRRPMLGTVADQVAVHAQCLVAMVPLTRLESSLTRTVVVVVDAALPVDENVFMLAAHEATLRHASLTVVRTDRLQRGADDPTTDEAAEPVWSAFTDALAALKTHYPDVAVAVNDARGAADSLPAADLVVVESHHDDDLWAIDVGPVAMTVIAEVSCPVLLVPVVGGTPTPPRHRHETKPVLTP